MNTNFVNNWVKVIDVKNCEENDVRNRIVKRIAMIEYEIQEMNSIGKRTLVRKRKRRTMRGYEEKAEHLW